MSKHCPILLIDDDPDEYELMEEILRQQKIPNPLHYFPNGQDAINYLRNTTDRPFLIICDINMPVMNGIEVRKLVNADEYLRKKSIPFVFYTTTATESSIKDAYEMSVQGFFVKEHDIRRIGALVHAIYTYWYWCRHPNKHH